MGHSNKRKTPPLSPERVIKQALSNTEDRRKKKGKGGGTPRGEPRHDLPPSTRYLPLSFGGSHWRGKESLINIVVFGDSCSKLADVDNDSEESSDTWVDHIRRNSEKGSPIRAYNFAFPGATAEDDLSIQFSQFKTSLRDATLNGENTTYFFFLGINDCGRTPSDDLEPITEVVFDVLHHLYTKFDARNFVLIDVPPIDRSPAGMALESNLANETKGRIHAWNELLIGQANDFTRGSNKATVFVFSSHQVLTEVLDEPLDFDFTEEDAETEGAGIWADDSHLTPSVHAIFAERMLDSLIKL